MTIFSIVNKFEPALFWHLPPQVTTYNCIKCMQSQLVMLSMGKIQEHSYILPLSNTAEDSKSQIQSWNRAPQY